MQKLNGIIAAPFTPMLADGALNLSQIKPYATKLKNDGVSGVFICGTTGEGMLMTLEERKAVAAEWVKYQDSAFRVIVHVGTTSSRQSQELASHASSIKAFATGCMGPMFLKPANVSDLVQFCAEVGSGAPDLPFYYYHIPTVSEVWQPMNEFLKEAQTKIPNLAGIKFTHRNMMEMQQCLHADNGKWDIVHGFDEELLSGLVFGAQAAIGSTYNYMAPHYLKIIEAFKKGDIEVARILQYQVVKLIEVLIKYGGGVVGGKPIMRLAGLDCGPLRAPAHNISNEQMLSYRKELETFGLIFRFKY